ncbi:MAG: hypothetical protein ABI042_04870 [Verrucomicrobiota bacterium]
MHGFKILARNVLQKFRDDFFVRFSIGVRLKTANQTMPENNGRERGDIFARDVESALHRGSRAWETKLGCARIISAAMTWFLLNQNDAAGLIAFDEKNETQFIRPSSRSTQFGLMLREMEKLQPAGGASLVNLLNQTARLVRRRSVILFFSDLLEPSADVELCFKQLRFHGHECLVFQMLDPDEIDFPFTESHLFEDMETGARRQVSPATAREKYLERFSAFMETHRKFFQSLEIPFCVIRNDENPWSALAMFLSERKRLK